MKTFLIQVQQIGFCCPGEFFIQHHKTPTKDLAIQLNLAPRTIRLHRQIAQNEPDCPGYPTCLARRRRPSELT